MVHPPLPVPRPMTRQARLALEAEAARLADDVAGRPPAPTDAPTPVALPARGADARLARLRTLLEHAVEVDDPTVAVIGRRVRLREASGAEWSCALVVPGDGDAARGWVSVDSPLGTALVGRRPGDSAEVAAPGGTWTTLVVTVE